MNGHWTDRLSLYLDGALAPAEREACEGHLAECAACAGTLADLRRVVARARSLEDRPPATDLWPAIAAGIGRSARGDVADLAERRRGRARRFSFTVPQLAAACVALVLLSGAAVWRLRAPSAPRSVAGGSEPPSAPTQWVSTGGRRYDAAVAELQRALAQGRSSGRLDSTTVRILERNLAIIDTAIVQAQRALAADPGSAYLNHHLADTMRRKLELLRQASVLASAQS